MNKVNYIDLTVRPIRRGGRYHKSRVASEIRQLGTVRLGNHRGWTGTMNVITTERKVRGLK